jgi:hypothetical protein
MCRRSLRLKAWSWLPVASRNASLPGVPHAATLDELLRDGPPIDAVALCTPASRFATRRRRWRLPPASM